MAQVLESGLEQAEGKKEMDHRTIKQVLEQRFKTKWNGRASLFMISNAFRNNTKHKDAVPHVIEELVACGVLRHIGRVETEGRPQENVYEWMGE
jgi:hypothetical protein